MHRTPRTGVSPSAIECSETEALKMVYDTNGHKSGCIEAGDIVRYEEQRWRVARTTEDYVEIYRRHETQQLVGVDEVESIPRPDEDGSARVMTDGGVSTCSQCGRNLEPDCAGKMYCSYCHSRKVSSIIENADAEPGDRVAWDGREWTFLHYCVDYAVTLVPIGIVASEETVERMVDVRDLDPITNDTYDPYSEYVPERDGRDDGPVVMTDGGIDVGDFDGVEIDGASDEDEDVEMVTGELLDELEDFAGEEIDEDGDVVSDDENSNDEDDSEDGEETITDDTDGENTEDVEEGSQENGEDEDDVSTTPIGELGEHMSPADMWSDAASYYQKNETDPAPRRAREMVAGALMAEMDWLCVRESSEPGSYDLRVYIPSRGCYVENASTLLSERMTKVLGGDATPTEVNHVTHLVANNCMVDEDDLDAADRDETLIPLENGVLVLESVDYDADTGTIDSESATLLDKSPEYLLTFSLPVEWNPDAADLDLVNDWMGSLTGFDDVDSRTIWEFGGHSLLPRMEPQGFLIVIGEGGNGKTTLFNAFIELLGQDNTTAIPLQKITDSKFSSYRMVNRLANLNPDISGNQINDVSSLKASTGDDMMEVERKGIDPYDARSTAAQIMGANSPPSITEKKPAVKRRLHPVILDSTFKADPDPDNPYEHEKDPELEDKLTSEAGLSAMLLKIVEGARRLQHQHEFTLAQKYDRDERLTLYESHADPVADFERACLERDPDGNGVAKADIKACYDAFARHSDHPEKDHDTLMKVLKTRQTTVLRPSNPRSWTEDGRTPIYKGMKFTEKAKENWLPEDAFWSQYGGRPDDGEDTVNGDGEDGVERTGLDDVRELDPGRYEDVGVKVEVAHELDARPWLHHESVVSGDGDTMRVQSIGEHTLAEGETYVITDFTIVPADGDTQIQLVPAQTDVTLIDTGSDQAGLPDDDNDGDGTGETVNEDADTEVEGEVEGEENAPVSESSESQQDAARADGGSSEGNTAKIDRAVREHADAVEGDAALAGQVSAVTKCNDLDEIKARIRVFRDGQDTNEDDGDEEIGESEFDGEDPPAPKTPLDTWQCRACGVHWGTDTAREECDRCGAEVDVEWNVETGRVSRETAGVVNGGEE